ncbi:MAG: WYL domain-containing protein [Anaerolineae bacterium]|nr:WYL domain-containing protein [Anaerolineae bacterium]
MAKDITMSKAARLQKIVHLLYRNPWGLTTKEIAKHCGVTPRTIQRDLNDLEAAGIPVWKEEKDGRYGIIKGYYLPPIHFNLYEASALYLAVRLLARYSDEHNPIIVQALAKLAGAMPEAIAAHIHHTIRSLAYRTENRTFARVLEIIALGWATGRKVRIWHQAASSENVHEYLFSPYFLEPSSVGYATYAIGYSSWFENVRTFKLERIRNAQLTEETFEIPEDFDGAELLSSAWGVMFGDEVVEVVLRFSPGVTRRVKESVWHPSQKRDDCDDGGCILRVWVARPLEMKPWIRGWGPDCEVLSPEWLRREIAEEMRRAAEMYRSG